MPTQRVTNEDLDLLDELTDRLRHYKGQHLGGYEVMNIGDPIAGRQMVMRMKPELIDGPISEKYAENWLIRATPGQLRQAVEDGTQRMASIDFGWAPEGMRVESPLAEMSYDAPRSPKNRAEARKQNLSGKLRAAMPELLDRMGMKPGDLVYNTPVGTQQGDYTRALAYMRHGFGAPSYDNQQFAMLNRAGGLEAWQPWGAHPGVGGQLGWEVPLTPQQQEQWQRHQESNRLAQQRRRERLGL